MREGYSKAAMRPPFRVGSFVLSETEVTRRKRYFELAARDEELLREAHPLIATRQSEIVERFYDFLLSDAHTRAILSAPGLLERLKAMQTRYFVELTSGRYDVPYFENRLRVGLAHERVGLSPEWYLGAYKKYLEIVSDVLGTALRDAPDRLSPTLNALEKIIFLDMSLAIDAYVYSAQERLEGKATELQEANRELKRLDAEKRRLTDMIVHDLQNPLAGIVAFLQILETRPDGLTPDEDQSVHQALARCNDLSQLIMNVLQISRAEEGKLEVYLENVDLVEIGRETVSAFAAVAERSGREIWFSSSHQRLLHRIDQSLLRRILFNLVRNALRHTPAGTRVELVVRAGPPVSIAVRDNGAGIPRELQHRIFEPGALREAGVPVDSGLGLLFCKLASEALGMTLVVESEPGVGSCFVLTESAEQTWPAGG